MLCIHTYKLTLAHTQHAHGKVNEPFLDAMAELVAQLNQKYGAQAGGNPGGAFLIRGPVKKPDRALQKLVRLYSRNPACLTDLVRCTVVVASLNEASEFLRLLVEKSAIGFELDDDDVDDGLAVLPALEWRLCVHGISGRDAVPKVMRIMRLKNRYLCICSHVCICTFVCACNVDKQPCLYLHV
jgi:hypothetical protein